MRLSYSVKDGRQKRFYGPMISPSIQTNPTKHCERHTSLPLPKDQISELLVVPNLIFLHWLDAKVPCFSGV